MWVKREKEWLRREGRNPRNVFGPEAPVTRAGERSAAAYSRRSVARRRRGRAAKPAAGGVKQEEGRL